MRAMSREAPERASSKPPARPFSHLRLIGFFVLLTAAGSAAGVAALRSAGVDPQAESVLVVTVVATCSIAFAGVFFHRLRTQVARWGETENYLNAIRRESQKYRTLLEGAADALLIVDPSELRILEWNGRARDLLGLRDPAPRSSLADMASGADLETLSRAIESAAKAHGETVSLSDVALRGRDGASIVGDMRCAAIVLDQGVVVQLSLRDRTREREIERTLHIHERLASIGLLTAGVAHEINNPLEGIANYLKLLRRPTATEDERARWLDLVDHGFGRIREIVRELLRFARPVREDGEADLAAAVDRARKLAAYSEKLKKVRIEALGFEAPLVVIGDAGRLEQVVVNLLLNAGTAMDGNGRITIRAQRVQAPSPMVEIEIADEGPGIPTEVLPRIFDPFFTTTGGTGLGLSVSYGIVQAHGGHLAARNAEGGGAVFTLRLPMRTSSKP